MFRKLFLYFAVFALVCGIALPAQSQNPPLASKVISQEEEGRIGFKTALGLYPELTPSQVIAWDSGGASFQISAEDDEGELQVYEGPLGKSLVAKIFYEEVKGGTMQNPATEVTSEEIKTLVKKIQAQIDAPKWLKDKLKEKDIVVISVGHGGIVAELLQKDNFSFREIQGLIEVLSENAQELHTLPLKDPHSFLLRIAFLFAVMEKFHIERVHFRPSVGGCARSSCYTETT